MSESVPRSYDGPADEDMNTANTVPDGFEEALERTPITPVDEDMGQIQDSSFVEDVDRSNDF